MRMGNSSGWGKQEGAGELEAMVSSGCVLLDAGEPQETGGAAAGIVDGPIGAAIQAHSLSAFGSVTFRLQAAAMKKLTPPMTRAQMA